MNILKRISFSQYMIPIIDSTKSKYIITSISGLAEMRNEIRKKRGFKSTLIFKGVGISKTS